MSEPSPSVVVAVVSGVLGIVGVAFGALSWVFGSGRKIGSFEGQVAQILNSVRAVDVKVSDIEKKIDKQADRLASLAIDVGRIDERSHPSRLGMQRISNANGVDDSGT